MAVFHTHAVAGSLGGILADFFAHPKLCRIFFLTENWQHYIGLAYGIHSGQVNAGFKQMRSQFLGLGLNGEQLQVSDDAIHGEKAYVMWEHGENTSTKTCLRDVCCLPFLAYMISKHIQTSLMVGSLKLVSYNAYPIKMIDSLIILGVVPTLYDLEYVTSSYRSLNNNFKAGVEGWKYDGSKHNLVYGMEEFLVKAPKAEP
ncbi:hypothetical protein DVH24_002903 [Malus domestica]|uniref:Uncharacterized protein n=1 Tax=Malus domestica TaxID=3750 RepID=A0A498KAG4_MALDO|nr:hypothetical protein DVH24_002903 [Malus domestica]